MRLNIVRCYRPLPAVHHVLKSNNTAGIFNHRCLPLFGSSSVRVGNYQLSVTVGFCASGISLLSY